MVATLSFIDIFISCDLKVSITAGIVQWHQAALVLGVDISTVGEQQLDYPRPVVAGSEVQRRRLPPVAGVAVDVEGGQQRQKLLLVPTAGLNSYCQCFKNQYIQYTCGQPPANRPSYSRCQWGRVWWAGRPRPMLFSARCFASSGRRRAAIVDDCDHHTKHFILIVNQEEDLDGMNLKEHNADIVLALDGSLVQWRVAPIVPGVGVCPSPLTTTMTLAVAMTIDIDDNSPQQKGDNLSVAKGAGIVQGNQATWWDIVVTFPSMWQLRLHSRWMLTDF